MADKRRCGHARHVSEHTKKFNQNIDSWQVGSVTMFAFTFAETTNQNIDSWQTGSGENFRDMFQMATAFNHVLSSLTVQSGADAVNCPHRHVGPCMYSDSVCSSLTVCG